MDIPRDLLTHPAPCRVPPEVRQALSVHAWPRLRRRERRWSCGCIGAARLVGATGRARRRPSLDLSQVVLPKGACPIEKRPILGEQAARNRLERRAMALCARRCPDAYL